MRNEDVLYWEGFRQFLKTNRIYKKGVKEKRRDPPILIGVPEERNRAIAR